MTKDLPNKWIRKAIFDELDGIVVDSNTINVYDTRVTGFQPDHYILLTTQTNLVEKENKCEYFWNSSILIDVVTTFERQGGYGSRVLVNDIMQEVKDGVNDMVLDPASGLEIITKTLSFPNDITTITDNEIVYRELLRLEMIIK